MTVPNLKHAFVSGKDDGADETLVRPSNWNAEHEIRWTLNKLLKGAGAGSDPTEIDVPTSRTIATGNYTGDNADDRQVTVGFKCSLVIVHTIATPRFFMAYQTATHNLYLGEPATIQVDSVDCILHATDGFVVDRFWANDGGEVYYYWAISE